ncbi:MAG: hypothetical protein IT560_08395 [Alphaproteobacteria bacterium]|nr:hypothetical protein [Alphaproteobacteria bacterium]
MANNQNVLVAVIFALVLLVGALVYHQNQRPATLGEKVGAAIEKAGDNIEDAADDVKRDLR